MVNDKLYVLALRVQVGLEAWPLCINGWREHESRGFDTCCHITPTQNSSHPSY